MKCSYCHKDYVEPNNIIDIAPDRHICRDCLKKMADHLFRLHFGMSPDRKPPTRT